MLKRNAQAQSSAQCDGSKACQGHLTAQAGHDADTGENEADRSKIQLPARVEPEGKEGEHREASCEGVDGKECRQAKDDST